MEVIGSIGSGASFLDQGLFGQFVALHGAILETLLHFHANMPFLWAGHVSERVYHHVHVSSYSQSFEAILPVNYESDTSPSHFLYALFQIILINVSPTLPTLGC